MKRSFFSIAVLLIGLVLVFALVSCDTGGGGGGGQPANNARDTLKLSGQVYEGIFDSYASTLTHKKFTGDHPVVKAVNADEYWYSSGPLTDLGGSGAITGGKLSFTIGAPAAGTLEPLANSTTLNGYVNGYGNTVTIIPNNANGVCMQLIIPNFAPLWKSNSGNSNRNIEESIRHIYVDRDFVITAPQATGIYPSVTLTYAPLNLSLKRGWNAIYQKRTYTSGNTATVQLSINDPSLDYVFREDRLQAH